MDYYGLEIKIDARKNEEEFKNTDTLIHSMICEKLSNSHNIRCAICNNNLNTDYRIAYRIFKEEKKVVAHPVHINCIKEENNFFNLNNINSEYTDVSKTDYCDMLKTIEVLKNLDKKMTY